MRIGHQIAQIRNPFYKSTCIDSYTKKGPIPISTAPELDTVPASLIDARST
ncbi:hypothetical protein LLF85_06235 [bacterium]|nr:hypothetical protein [bacterium]